MVSQEQFLDVIDRQEAEQRFHDAIRMEVLSTETIPIAESLGRVLAEDVQATVDVPSFDRSNYDGFAVRAANTFGAGEEVPMQLRLADEVIATAVVPAVEIESGMAAAIATGGMVPRGADAIVMVEHADVEGSLLIVRKAVTSGFGIAFAGTDISSGETVLRRGEVLTSRETGVLAAIGVSQVSVWRRPTVAVISTGDEIIAPGDPMQSGRVYDSNARILADAVREQGGQPIEFGIVTDDEAALAITLHEALDACDIVLLSGGTSKGAGDISYRVVQQLDEPGIVAHGVALKPGKPICLAAQRGKPVVILPGFPTSAIFTFHEFVAPVIRCMAGRSEEEPGVVPATMAVKVNSEIGRTEYMLVGLVQRDENDSEKSSLAAYPMGKGSGSVTAFSRADGFVTIGRHQEIIPANADVLVTLLGRETRPADLVVIGSHCVGLDLLLGYMQDAGFRTKFLSVGSTAGLEAVRREECDLAGIHLLDAESGQYNLPFLSDSLELISGYQRQQGVVFRPGDTRFVDKTATEAISHVSQDLHCVMVNRNQGSGTRILIDEQLGGKQPQGYAVQARNHTAVAVAVAQGRADWGVAVRYVAEQQHLGFLPLAEEQYDFVMAKSRQDLPAVKAFRDLLADHSIREALVGRGFAPAG